MIFANSLDPDQDQQNFSTEMDPNRLTLIVFLKNVGRLQINENIPSIIQHEFALVGELSP